MTDEPTQPTQPHDHSDKSHGLPIPPGDWAKPQPTQPQISPEQRHEVYRLERELAQARASLWIARDGFIGTIVGTYLTREGVAGVVLQQEGTKVIHVYRQSSIEPYRATSDDNSKSQAG